jgi:hypothetical protein
MMANSLTAKEAGACCAGVVGADVGVVVDAGVVAGVVDVAGGVVGA